MKKILAAALMILAFATSAWSVPIMVGSTDVGSLDTLLAQDKLKNSGDTNELNWVIKSLGDLGLTNTGITMDAKYTNMDWKATNQTGTFALLFQNFQPEYFVVKTGNLQDTENEHFLFRNDPNLDWGVVNLQQQLGIQSIVGIGKFSHVDEFNGGTAPVPEPATLMLIGSGLLGIAGFRKKVK